MGPAPRTTALSPGANLRVIHRVHGDGERLDERRLVVGHRVGQGVDPLGLRHGHTGGEGTGIVLDTEQLQVHADVLVAREARAARLAAKRAD